MTSHAPGKRAAFAELMQVRNLEEIDPAEVTISGEDPFYSTPYRVGEAVAASIAAVGVAANDIWQLRTGRRQKLDIDVRAAAATLRPVDDTRARQHDALVARPPTPPE